MFPNLRAEMARIGIDGVKLASHLGCTPKTLSRKMTGKGEFTLAEIFKIQSVFPNHSIEYLFETNRKKHTA
jgi:plasmid maintenance system antidote protein VapI